MRHAENSIETGIGIRDGCVLPDRGILLEETLKTSVGERIIHLAGMEVDLHLRVQENARLAFLIDDVVDRDLRLVKGLQDGIMRPFDPQVDITAHASFRNRIQMRQSCSLQDAPMEPKPCKQSIQLGDMILMGMIYPANLRSLLVPLLQQVLRRHLMSWQPVDAHIQDTDQRLLTRHAEHHLPGFRIQVLLERRIPAQSDQEQFAERMHANGGRPSRKDDGPAGVWQADGSHPPTPQAWRCGSG